MDQSDLRALMKDATPEEVDCIHRLLHDWSVGPEKSFPVQLALLTRTQWRVAAKLPQTMEESRKLLETDGAEHRRQINILMQGFVTASRVQANTFEKLLTAHAATTAQAVQQIQIKLAEAEHVAQRISMLIEDAGAEWKGIRATTQAQCNQLKMVSKELQNRFAWQQVLWALCSFLLTLGLGILIGHLFWRRS